jgi:hypothetical protein
MEFPHEGVPLLPGIHGTHGFIFSREILETTTIKKTFINLLISMN